MDVRIATWSVVFLFGALGANRSDAQSLDGVWEISTVVDNGRVIEPTDVLLNYAADGKVVISGNSVSMVVPMTFQRKKLPFNLDPSKSPATVDLAFAERTGGKGIVMSNNDTLLLCLAARDKNRPKSFASLPGSGNLLVTLKRLSSDEDSTLPAKPPAQPSYEDQQLRRMLAGTWGHQDPESIHYITLNPDGTMNATMTWKDNFKQMFHQDVRSSGTWNVKDGVVILNVDNSTDKERRGQVTSFRVRSINSTELVAVDHAGQVRQEWKAP
jgi:uncharacterized protein (TIGR03067 family)